MSDAIVPSDPEIASVVGDWTASCVGSTTVNGSHLTVYKATCERGHKVLVIEGPDAVLPSRCGWCGLEVREVR